MEEESQLYLPACLASGQAPPPEAGAISSQEAIIVRVGRGDRLRKSPSPSGLLSRGAGPCPAFLRAGVPPSTSFSLLEPQALLYFLSTMAIGRSLGALPQVIKQTGVSFFHCYFLPKTTGHKGGECSLLFSLGQRSKYSSLALKECPAFPSETGGWVQGTQCFCLALGGQTFTFSLGS